MKLSTAYHTLFLLLLVVAFSCKDDNTTFSKTLIAEMNLKRGNVISCGSPDLQFGSVDFPLSCKNVKDDFNLAISLLHSFEYDEAEKVFARVIDEQPDCAMGFWGVAMSNFHPLWTPPTEAELKKGARAVEIAQSISGKTKREEQYINAIAAFYKDWDKVDHKTRCINFEKEMEKLFTNNPDDKEAAIFYALSLNASADPSDKTFSKQKKAANILNKLYPEGQNHPGVVHYIIHTYDWPQLAVLGLPAARRYASVAPSSAHALHMPSHIFTRLGLWEEGINSNLASITAAKCYADSSGIKGHWDEELHGLDYLVYGYLQRGNNTDAKKQWDYLKTIKEVHPLNFKVAYAFASIPARYVLENKQWNEAAQLKVHLDDFSWEGFQWQKAIIHFTRLVGSAHIGDLTAAKNELKELSHIHEKIVQQKDAYKAMQVKIQMTAGEAWIKFREGNNEEALKTMRVAAELEDATEKHPVTPGEVLPVRQQLADMLMQMNKPQDALVEYEAELQKHPNRFNALLGAGAAASQAGDKKKSIEYYQQLIKIADPASTRAEMAGVRALVARG